MAEPLPPDLDLYSDMESAPADSVSNTPLRHSEASITEPGSRATTHLLPPVPQSDFYSDMDSDDGDENQTATATRLKSDGTSTGSIDTPGLSRSLNDKSDSDLHRKESAALRLLHRYQSAPVTPQSEQSITSPSAPQSNPNRGSILMNDEDLASLSFGAPPQGPIRSRARLSATLRTDSMDATLPHTDNALPAVHIHELKAEPYSPVQKRKMLGASPGISPVQSHLRIAQPAPPTDSVVSQLATSPAPAHPVVLRRGPKEFKLTRQSSADSELNLKDTLAVPALSISTNSSATSLIPQDKADPERSPSLSLQLRAPDVDAQPSDDDARRRESVSDFATPVCQ